MSLPDPPDRPLEMLTPELLLALLEDMGLHAPDDIEHDDAELRLLWEEQKVAVILEMVEPDADAGTR